MCGKRKRASPLGRLNKRTARVAKPQAGQCLAVRRATTAGSNTGLLVPGFRLPYRYFPKRQLTVYRAVEQPEACPGAFPNDRPVSAKSNQGSAGRLFVVLADNIDNVAQPHRSGRVEWLVDGELWPKRSATAAWLTCSSVAIWRWLSSPATAIRSRLVRFKCSISSLKSHKRWRRESAGRGRGYGGRHSRRHRRGRDCLAPPAHRRAACTGACCVLE